MLSVFTPTRDQPLPDGMGTKWALYRDEEFIISTLLQSGGRMTKNQLISKAAKAAFGHVGAKDKSRINPRLSRLRTLKLIDYPEGRQKRGAHIYIEVCNSELICDWQRVAGE